MATAHDKKMSSIKRCTFAIVWACMVSSGTATLAFIDVFTADASKR